MLVIILFSALREALLSILNFVLTHFFLFFDNCLKVKSQYILGFLIFLPLIPFYLF